MAMDRIHYLFEASIILAIAIERQGVRWLRLHMISPTQSLYLLKKEFNKSCRIGPIKKGSPIRHLRSPYRILALFLVDNLALCTGLITVPNVALLTALQAARYPASSNVHSESRYLEL